MDRNFDLGDLQFEWDEEKYASNLRKHGVKFEEAAEVFFDRFNIIGDASVDNEKRQYVIGLSFSANMLIAVFLERTQKLRIVSARAANSYEKSEYVEQF